MIASKLTFNSEMLEALNSPVMTPKKKAELRRKRVLDYVKKHEGEEIHIAVLIREAGYNPIFLEGDDSYKRGWALIDNMVRKQDILKEKGTTRGKAKYFIYHKAAPKIAKTKLPEISLETAKNIVEKPVDYERNVPRYEVFIDRAKKFAWDHNSDSLRDFIKTLQ